MLSVCSFVHSTQRFVPHPPPNKNKKQKQNKGSGSLEMVLGEQQNVGY